MQLQPEGAHAALRAAANADLQPEVDVRLSDLDLITSFSSPTMLSQGALVGLARDLVTVGPGREADEIRKAAENLARRQADDTFYSRIVADGFEGSHYDLLILDLIAYAQPTLLSWLRRGTIFAQSKQRGRPVQFDERDQEELRGDRDLRIELANEIIAEAIRLFRTKGLAGTGWTVEGGAALTTYFVGACMAVFPVVWRRWRRERPRDRAFDHTDPATDFGTTSRKVLNPRLDDDPADLAATRDIVRTELAKLEGSLRDIVELVVLHGLTFAEVAERLGTTEGAVEQKLRRFRKQIIKRRKERGGS